jgi:hypothetical protein
MKRYKLTKDLPTFRAGQLAYVSSLGNLMAGTPEKPETTDTGLELMMYHRTTLKKFPEILTEWFEEIQEESTDSIHWKPEYGDEYWFVDYRGDVDCGTWGSITSYIDVWNLDSGNIYLTEEECSKARDRELAEARLRRTSNFKPDFKLGCGGYAVYYDHVLCALRAHSLSTIDSGEIVRYETMEDAGKSIRENREDWLTYLGVEEEI